MKTNLGKFFISINDWIPCFRNLLSIFLLIFLFSAGIYAQTTWYSYQSGNWTDWRTWTTDPSGTTLINPGNNTPSSAVNNTVVILNGRTVTIQAAVPAITTLGFTIQEGAVLDLTTNTFVHSFGIFSGSGLLRLSTATFPTFASGSFVNAGGGTVEYRNMGGFTLTQFTFNNLVISLNNPADEVLYDNAAALTINGNITIEKGILRIGSSAAGGAARTVRVFGNAQVDASGQILVGAQRYRHQIYFSGNLTNYGIIRLTTLLAPNYTTDPPLVSDGYSDAIFDNSGKDQFVYCGNTSVFYRIQISKGTDQTYILNIDANSSTNFQLMGRNNRQDFNPGTAPNIPNMNALGLLSGTLRLGPGIIIPSLTTNCYVVDEDAGIWFDGCTVSFNSVAQFSGIYAYGKIRFSSDCLASFAGQIGMILRESGNYEIESGTITTQSLRTSVLGGATHRGSFKMYGGSLTLTGYDDTGAADNHASFSIPFPENVFVMSGGIIDIKQPNNAGGIAQNFSMVLGSLPRNINVTGGTIRINSTPRNAYFNSRVPLPNLQIYGTANTFQVRPIAGFTGLTVALPLIILHDLSLENSAVFNNTQNVDLLIGGDFYIPSGTTYTPGTNTTIFNGSGPQTFDILGTISGNLNNLTLSNASDLTLNNTTPAVPVIVKANLQIDDGCTLNDNGRILQVQGNISNSGTHFKPVSGAGSIQLTGAAVQVITGDGSGMFNNLTLNKTSGSVNLQANTIITGDLRLANTAAILNIGSNNLILTATGDIFDNLTGTSKNFNNTRMIQTSGLLSDGGLSKTYTNTNAFLFPFGFYNSGNSTYYYMPASVRYAAAPSAYGTVTTRPVNTRHPLSQSANSLACYWKTSESGFSGVPANSVIHNYTYDGALSNFFVSGTESNYIPAAYRNNGAGNWISINNVVLVNDGNNVVTYDTAYTAEGEYTAGEPAAFGPVQVRYSTGLNGDWNNTATWSSTAVGGPGGASVPDGNTLVIIGDATHSHTVTINQNGKNAGSLTIYSGSVLDLQATIGHNFEALPDKGVSGSGTLRIAANNYFPRGDFGDFIGETGGTVDYYTIGAGSILIPTVSDITGLTLDHYFNLTISPQNTAIVTLPNSNLNIYNDLNIIGTGTGQVNTNTLAVHTITVNHDLIVTSGIFEVRNNNAQTIKVYRDLNVNGTFRVYNLGTAVNHVLELYGSLTGSGTFNLNNAPGRIFSYFKGITDASIRGAAKSFYSLEVNKGTSQTPVLNVRAAISTSAAFDPALTLRNGTIRIKQGTLSLSATRSFTIPETGCLSVDSLANITVVDNNVNDSSLFLIGKLEVLSGTLNVGNMVNNRRNCIEYSSEGNPTIMVSGGNLNVNGQIKRNSLITQGALQYTQSNGTVTIYGKNYDNTRAKFEICNNSSSFAFSGGNLNIIRGGGVDFGDVYIRPEISNVTGGTMNLSQGTLTSNQTYNIDASCNLHNLSVTGNATNVATARIMVNALVLSGNLNIATNSVLNCNNRNVSVEGNYTNNGTYTAGTNTTIFNGSNTQSATFGVATTFNKLLINKTTGTGITFSGAVNPVISDSLTINGGSLINANNFNIIAQGNIINSGIHASATGLGSLVIQGTKNQIISGNGNGQFGNVNFSNGAANGVTLANDITLNGVITLTSGYLYADEYRITLSAASSISAAPVPGNPANNNWIITNGVLSDKGVTKVFPPSSPATFTFPIGVANKYTPATYTLSYTGAPGSITIKPINNRIPSLTDAPLNELQYYWNVTNTDFGGLTSVSHSYKYLSGDIQGTLETNATFVGARYYSNVWTNLGHGVINIGNHSIDLTGTAYIDGEYTCGEAINFASKPVYYSYDNALNITTTGADWNMATSWATGGHNGTVSTSPPDGNPIIIKAGHKINITNDDRSAYSILDNGILNINSTIGHNFGHVSGNGRFIIVNTLSSQFVFPGGDYTGFLNTTGSTVEYNGSNGPMLSSSVSPTFKTYQNLEFTGSIAKSLSCVNLLIKGNLLITGSQVNNTLYNKDIIIWGNWTDSYANGFLPGKGVVSFEGSALQTITTPNPEHFYNFRINNPSGVALSGTAEISNRLYLTNGRINTTSTNLLTITNTSPFAVIGGSDASFVDGPLNKRILLGQSFNFPVGNFNASAGKPTRYGNVLISEVSATNDWRVQYINNDPNGSYSRSNLLSPLTWVSNNEYWIVTRPGANTANVRLRWDNFSNIGAVNSTRVAEWVTPSNRWEEKGNVAAGTLSSGTVATSVPVATDNYIFTLGVTGVTARITNVNPASVCNNGDVITVTVVLTGSPNWTLSYNAGPNSFVQSGISSGTYNIQLTGADFGGPGTYNVQLTAVSDASSSGIVDGTTFPVTILNSYIPDITGATFTVGVNESRAFSTALHGGSTYVWQWVGASGGSIPGGSSESKTIAITGTPGVYQLQVIETNAGCSSSDIQAITVVNTPAPSITPTNSNICIGTTLGYSTTLVANHEYRWTVTNGNCTGCSATYSTTQNSISVTWNSAGAGSVMVDEHVVGSGSPGTFATNTVNVVVDPQPLTSLIVTAPASVCDGSIAIINVAGSQSGFSYQLREGVINIGSSVAGTGGGINLPSGVLTGNTTFNVLSYNNGCSEQLTTTPTVAINPLPGAAGAITGTSPVCQGQNNVSYSVGAITNATSYTWSYSGTGATITGGTTNAVTISFAANATSGTLTVQGVNACGGGTVSTGYPITVNPLPAAAGAITGTSPVCQGQNNVSYSVGAITNATSYTWSYSGTGATITGGTTNAVTISFAANATSGTLTVQGVNACGSGTVSTGYPITVNPLPGAAGAITGTSPVCQGQNNVSYSVGAITNATSYTWSYSGTGATITGGTTNAVTISFAANATSGTLTVQGVNACGSGTVSTGYPITVNPLPGAAGAITGTSPVCQGQNNVSYSVGAITNATSYTWSYSGTGATITGGTTNAVTISFAANATSGTLTVQGVNACGSGTVSTGYPITVNPLPGAAGAITGTSPVCQGQNNVSYSVGAITNATSYTWSYSGTGATITGGTTNAVTISFAANATSGTLTVQGVNACGNGTVSAGYAITVNPLPGAAGAITGTSPVCQGQNNVSYSVGAITNATSYTWSYSGTGATITGGTTNAVTISFAANATSGTLTVQGVNACGSGTVSTGYPITVNPLPAAAGAITGTSPVCQGQNNVSYSVGAITNATSYTWSYSGTGATITGGTTNAVTISFAANATSGTLTVQGVNACGSGTVSTGYPITVNPLPGAAGAITGTSPVCQGQNNVSYSVGAITNATSYTWSYSGTGATITGGTTNAVTISFAANATSGTLTVQGVNACGSGTVSTGYPITVNPLPGAAGAITGTSPVCQGQNNVSYSVGAITNATSYTWSYSGTGATITGGTTNAVTISFAANATSGTLTVQGVNACGSGTVSTGYPITVNPLPGAAGAITGTSPVCQGQNNVSYSVGAITNATSYTWSYSGTGATITGGTTNAVTISFAANATSGTLTVQGVNACGSGTVSTGYPITVNPLPGAAGAITGTSPVCQGQNNVSYSVGAITNATSYTWSYSGTGATITGGTTNAVTISFAANATSGTLTVQGVNACGNGTVSAGYAITVNPLPAAAGAITGTSPVCQGQNNVSYSVGAITNATSYTWSYSGTGATITGGTTNAVTISFAANATSGTLTVQGVNACGNGTVSASYPITVIQSVGVPVFDAGITSTRCHSAGTVVYTATASNSTGITYTLDAGSTAAGNTINSASGEVTYDADWYGTSTITATAFGCNGPVAATHTSVTSFPLTSSITGAVAPSCMATGVAYSVAVTAGSSYSWSVPTDATIASGETGPGNNQILIDFGMQSGNVTVIETDASGCQGDPVSLAITILGCNISAGFIANDTVICLGESVLFTDASQGMATGTYQWSFGADAVPASATGMGPHTVQYLTAGSKSVQLIVENGISDTLLKVDYITVNSIPTVSVESADRCGAGDVVFSAMVTHGDQVEFSLDGGITVIETVSSPPFEYEASIAEGSSLQVWARAMNTLSGCVGTWDSSAHSHAFEIPVAEMIASAHTGSFPEGYVDVECYGQSNAYYYVRNPDHLSSYNWRIPELDSMILDTVNFEIDWDFPAGDYTLQLEKTSADGCVSAIRDTLVMISQPDPDLGGEVALCGNDSYTFDLTDQFTNYLWQDNSEGPIYTATTAGEVSVKVWDAYSCSGTDTVMVSQYSNPVVNLGNDTILCGDNALILDAGDFAVYDWSTNEIINPITVHEGAGLVSVTVTDENGCQAYDEILIGECTPETLLGIITNAFTPNEDNVHDYWEINNIHLFPDADIQVFDRWGRLVFRSDGGYRNNWNGTGTNGKDLPMDTYYYIIDLKIDGVEPVAGTITIIR